MPHAKIEIIVDFVDPLLDKTKVRMMFEGCEEHMIQAITELLLNDDIFKRMINKATRQANIERQKNQN